MPRSSRAPSDPGRWRFVETDRPDAAFLERFFQLYDRVFTLVPERETHEGFVQTLTLNHDTEVQRCFGPFSERLLLVLDGRQVVGAMNHVIYAMDRPEWSVPGGPGPVAAGQLNFLCTDADHREQGIATAMLEHLDREVLSVAHRLELAQARANAGRVSLVRRVPALVTCEQNDPARMTALDRLEDVMAAGISPETRRVWWYRQGFRRLDFPYVQPALIPGGDACDFLDLHVRYCLDGTTPAHDSVPTPWLLELLRRFFNVSVGKNEVDFQGAMGLLRTHLTGSTVTVADDVTLIHQMMRRMAQEKTGQ